MNLFARNQLHLVAIEQIRLLYRSMTAVILANLFIGLVLVYALWDVTSRHILIVWIGFIFGLSLLRVILYIFYRAKFNGNTAQLFAWILVASNAVSGLLWGFGTVAMFPGQVEHQLFILFVLSGMGAGSLPSLGMYLPAFYAYFPISILPIGIKLILVGEKFEIALGLLSLAYIIVLSTLVLNINRAIKESLKLRFEKIGLVEQLREQKEEAEQANISKSKFLAAASHDLRQPLHALTLFTSVLDEAISNPKVRAVVEQINSSVQALQSLFNALLDISRLEAGVMKVEKTDFPLQSLLNKLVNEYNPQALEKGLHISWPSVSHTVHSDPALLEQILRNYISNAIRYTQNGEVRIDCESADGQLTIKVIDTGVGIPVEEQRAIFEEFHQLSNPERDRSKGLGLGLAIVERSAKLLGHAIEVESTLGKGSTFSIIVALSTASTTPITAITHASPPHAALRQLDDMFVVVIDDEARSSKP